MILWSVWLGPLKASLHLLQYSMSKNILITGGLGYVGGRLTQYLSSSGYQVYALSRSKRNIGLKNVSVLTNESVLVESVLEDIQIDVIIHLAATNEIVCGLNPALSNEININGTLQWLKWAEANQVVHFIYFSTVHVYDRPLKGEYSEISNCNPAHPYSITHKAAEDYVNWYHRDFNINCSIIRLSNSFGFPAFNTSDRWSLFVNDICKQIVANKEIVINSNRHQQRDFISLYDVCSAVELIIEKKETLKKKSYPSAIYNLSRGSSKSLMEMSMMVQSIAEEYFNEKINLLFDKEKDAEEKELVISNKKLKALGWSNSLINEKAEIIGLLDFIIKHNLM